MSVQLHYYGSVFDLAEDREDDAWREAIAAYRRQAQEAGHPVHAWLPLADGRTASMLVAADTPLAVVA